MHDSRSFFLKFTVSENLLDYLTNQPNFFFNR